MIQCSPLGQRLPLGNERSILEIRADEGDDGEVERTTIIWLESLDSVKNFMGEDYQRVHVPENAQTVLKRFESEAKHYE